VTALLFGLISVLHKKYNCYHSGRSAFWVSFLLCCCRVCMQRLQRIEEQVYKGTMHEACLTPPRSSSRHLCTHLTHRQPSPCPSVTRQSSGVSTLPVRGIVKSNTHARHADLSGWPAERHPLAIYCIFTTRMPITAGFTKVNTQGILPDIVHSR
jgi:hypothetical protein